MPFDPALEKLEALEPLPGLDLWQREQVLSVRTGDITTRVFLDRLERKALELEELHRTAQASSMDTEAYLVAQDYYRTVSESLDLYLVGIEALHGWISTGDPGLLRTAQTNFEVGDEAANQAFKEAVRLELQAREIDEELLRQMGYTV